MHRRWIGITLIAMALLVSGCWTRSYRYCDDVTLPIRNSWNFTVTSYLGRVAFVFTKGYPPKPIVRFGEDFSEVRILVDRGELKSPFFAFGGDNLISTGQRRWKHLIFPQVLLFFPLAGLFCWHLIARSRWRKCHWQQCPNCGYDLRGTLAANRDACPECGAAIAKTGAPAKT